MSLRLIRRYANRKLYDVEESRYVSLKELGDLVAQGVKLKVEQADSGEDITLRTLARLRLIEAEETMERVRALPETVRKRLEQGWSDLRTRLTSAEDGLTALRVQLAAPLAAIGRLAQKIESLEAELKRLSAQVDALVRDDQDPKDPS